MCSLLYKHSIGRLVENRKASTGGATVVITFQYLK